MQSIVSTIPAFTFLMLQVLWGRVSCNALASVCHPYYLFLGTIVLALFLLKKILNHYSVLALLALLLLQAQIGILQFASQSDLGLQYLGEATLANTIPGIAKFSIGTEKITRAYGLMPHANVFGGSMLASIFLASFLPASLSKRAINSTFLLALAVSFSRTALAGYLLFLVVQHFYSRSRNLLKTLSRIAPIFLLMAPLLWFRVNDTDSVSLSERFQGYEWATEIIKQNGFFNGSGLGTYSESLKDYLFTNGIHYNYWEIAPVHSVPLLLSAELGIVTTLLVLLAIAGFTLRSQFWYIVIFAPALLFDHYFVTVPSALFLLLMLYTFWNGGGIPKITSRSTASAAS